MSFISNAVFVIIISAVPIYITSFLEKTEFEAGAVLAFMGLGYLLGAAIVRKLNLNMIGQLYINTALGISAAIFSIYWFSNLFAIAFSMLLFGTCMSVRNVVGWTYMQQIMPRNLIGQITSIQRMFGWGGCAIGPLVGSLIIKFYSIRTELVFCGALTIISLIISINISRKNSSEFVIET